jgi:aminotransferase EvaB
MIKSWDYLNEYHRDREQILGLVDRVFSSGRLILGKEVDAFENNFSAYCGAAHGVGVNSGTDALFLALKALGLGQGDEVITVANTAVPTVAAIRATGATPVFVDVEEDTFLMDAAKLDSALSSKTRCILPVHLYGQPVDMDPVLDISSRKGLFVVEDCAQATGAVYKGKKVGTFGSLGAFSFYPTKVLGGFGDGGMIVTDSGDLCDRVRRLRFYGMREAYYAEEEGFNSRLDEVHAAILNFKLQSVDEEVKKRRDLAEGYSRELAGIGDLILPSTRSNCAHQFYVYTVRTSRRDGLNAYLRENGIEGRIHYPVPIHLMRGYQFLGYREGDLPVTERLAREILSFPLYPGMSMEDMDRVIRCVRDFYGNRPGGKT